MTEEIEFFQRKIAAAETPESRIQLLNTASSAIHLSAPAQAYEWAEEAVKLAHQLGNSKYIAECLLNLGTSSNALARFREAIDFFEQARERFREIGEAVQVANATGNMGLAYSRLAEYGSALECYREGLEQAEAIGNTTMIGRSLNSIGSIYLYIGNYPQALEYCSQSLRVREAAGDTNIGPVINNLANIHLQLGNIDTALDYYSQSLKLCTETSNEYGRGLALVNIAEVHLHRKDYETALRNQFEALTIFTASCNREMQAQILCNIGTGYEEQGDLETALDYQMRAIEIARDIEKRRTLATSLSRIGAIHRMAGRLKEAETVLVEALELAVAIKVRPLQMSSHELLADVYEATGEPAKSLEHLREAMRINEEELEKEQKQVLEEINMRVEVEKVQREKELYRLKNVELAGALREVEQLNVHLQEISNEKTELLGIVTHELRNPLTGILASVTLMKEYLDRMSEDEITRQLKKIEETVRRSSATIDHLLDINAIEAGRVTLALQPLCACAVARQVVALYDERATLKRLELRFECTTDDSTVLADEKTLFDVVDNLVSNAVKYSPQETRIAVVVSKQNGTISIAVHDQGPGLTEEDKKKLFGKFQRLSARPTGGEASTGLGLYISRQIIELHGGKILAESAPEGGSIFTIELPACNIPEEIPAV